MFSQRRLSTGVSLLEVCFVVAIIGVLTATLIPPIRKAQEAYVLTAVAHHIRAQLHHARILAVVGDQDCRLRVSSPTSYLVECQTPAWIPVQVHEVRSGYTVRANNRPEFHPRGNVAPMATITVLNSSGQEKRVIVNRSGRVRIE